MELRRIHPDPAPVSVDEIADSLDLAVRAPQERPYLIANMVATADGRAAIAGRSGPIGGEADRALFHALRGAVDAVLVGAQTLRTERYGRLVGDPAAREARVRRGLAADPLAATLTRSGRLDPGIPLLADEASTIVIFTEAELGASAWPATVHQVRLGPGELTARAAVECLRRDHGVRSVLCEGGPALLRSLLEAQAVDELFLTVAPQLAAGEPALTILAGPELAEPVGLRLVWALESEGELLLRYAVAG